MSAFLKKGTDISGLHGGGHRSYLGGCVKSSWTNGTCEWAPGSARASQSRRVVVWAQMGIFDHCGGVDVCVEEGRWVGRGGWRSWRIPQGWEQEADVKQQQPAPMRLWIWLLLSERQHQPMRKHRTASQDFLQFNIGTRLVAPAEPRRAEKVEHSSFAEAELILLILLPLLQLKCVLKSTQLLKKKVSFQALGSKHQVVFPTTNRREKCPRVMWEGATGTGCVGVVCTFMLAEFWSRMDTCVLVRRRGGA